MTTDGARRSTAERVAESIRELIAKGELLPGHELRQAALAERLNFSRVPVREALQLLAASGVVRHTPGSGYTVARLTADELSQLYLLRNLFESTILRAIPAVTESDVEHLDALNEQMRAEIEGGDVQRFQALNQQFHMDMFALSKLDLVIEELRRLWAMSETYRVLWAQNPANRRRSVEGHTKLLDVLRSGDLSELARVADDRRRALTEDMNFLLAR
jgi:DNA-binding GntR family transcriptional regulator